MRALQHLRPPRKPFPLPTEQVEAIIRPEEYRWRVGRKVGRTIYLVLDRNGEPGDEDVLIGVMDTADLAAEAVRAHNLDRDLRSVR